MHKKIIVVSIYISFFNCCYVKLFGDPRIEDKEFLAKIVYNLFVYIKKNPGIPPFTPRCHCIFCRIKLLKKKKKSFAYFSKKFLICNYF